MIASALAIVALVAQLGGVPLEGYTRTASAVGPIDATGWSESEVERLSQSLPRVAGEIGTRLGRELETPIRVVLTPDDPEFRRVVGQLTRGGSPPEGAVGVAVPSLRTLVLRGGLILRYSPFAETLRHEIAHLILHQGAEEIPRWLDEGLAMWVSDHRPSPSDESHLGIAARVGGIYSLEKLRDEFPRAHRQSSLAYLQSYAWIEFLVERHGEGIVPRLVESVRGGDSHARLARVTGVAESELDDAFADWLAARSSLPWSIIGLLNFWTVSAILAVAAIVRHRIRFRRALRKMAEDEEREAAEGTSERVDSGRPQSPPDATATS